MMFKKAKPNLEENLTRQTNKEESLMNEFDELGELSDNYGVSHSYENLKPMLRSSIEELDPYVENMDRRKSISVETIKKTILDGTTQRSFVFIDHFQVFPDEFINGIKRKDPGEEYFLLVIYI